MELASDCPKVKDMSKEHEIVEEAKKPCCETISNHIPAINIPPFNPYQEPLRPTAFMDSKTNAEITAKE